MTAPGSELVPTWDPSMMTGLEDFTAEDLKLGRLVIDQKLGVFRDTLSGSEYTAIHAIPLAVVKQRVLWAPTVDDDSMPLCKSTDNEHGYPTTWDKPANNFPWGASGWQITDFPKDEVGRTVLPCGDCRLKEWKSHPDGKKPWCSMQHAVPMLYAGAGDDPFMQAVFTFQRSSLPSSQAYFAGFMQKGIPTFAQVCEITLNKQRRGQNDYYVPQLRVIRPTDQSSWPEYAEQGRNMRDFLRQPPLTRDESGEVVAASMAQSNVIQAQPTGFDNSTWTPQAPVQQAPIVTSPIATPVQQVPAQAVVQPMQVVQPQVQQPQYVPTNIPPVSNDDDLPF